MGKKILSFILVICLVFSTFTSVLAQGFLDMPLESYWSYKALNDAVANGLIKGYNNQLNPKNYVTRAQIATILNRAFGAIETEDITSFSDVSNDAWYAEDMAKAVKMGTFKGDSSKELSPLANATRQETFVVLARALKLSGSDAIYLDKFSDKNEVAEWAKSDIAALVNAGYVNGSNGKLNPKDKITLEEFAQLMSNIISHYISKTGTYTEVGNGNVMINTTDVTLKDVNINGDLIVGEGAADSDITLDNVTVKGRLIVRGGGQNSIKLVNKSNVGSIVIGKTASGAIRLKTEEGCKVDLVYVDDGKDDIIIEGVLNTVAVATSIPVILNDANVAVVSVSAETASVKIEGSSTVQVAQVQNTAVGASIEVSKEATVQKVDSEANEVKIGGEGTVVEAVISGNDTVINTVGTELTVEEGTTGVVENGNIVEGDGNKTQTGQTEPTTPSEPSTPTIASSRVSTSDGFKAAIENSSIDAIEIVGSFTFEEDNYGDIFRTNKSITVESGVTLTIKSNLEVQGNFINNGTVIVFSDDFGVTTFVLGSSDTTQCNFINNGTLKNNGILEIYESVTNNGTFENNNSLNYYDILGIETDSVCTLISNVTGNGIISKIAVVLSQTALEDALSREENGEKYYTDYIFEYNDSISNFDGTFTLPEGEISIAADHKIIILNSAKLIVPDNCTLTIEEDGFLRINGELIIVGRVINKGFYLKTITGKIDGSIEGDGDYSVALTVTNIDEWNEAIANNKCYAIVVDGNITINNDAVINSYLVVNEGSTLTIDSGMTLTVNTTYDSNNDVQGNSINGRLVINGELILKEVLCARVNGTIDNNGTITIDNRSGLYMDYVDDDNHGTIDNETGIIRIINGWADLEDEHGNPRHGFIANPSHVVETYTHLVELAREIWHRENPNGDNTGILPEATVEDITGYETEFADWNDIDSYDVDTIKGISMLIKNGIITGTTVEGKKYIYPYDALYKKDVAVILYNFIQKAIEIKGFENIDTGTEVAFTDISSLTETEKTAINYLSKAGVLLDNSTEFKPDDMILTVWKNPNGTEIDGGSDLCKLVNNIFNKLSVITVTTETELIDAINSNAIQSIKINGDITLTDSLTITKRVEVLQGKSLTVATGQCLIISLEGYSYGELTVGGVLSSMTISEGAELKINEGRLVIASNGTVTNNGAVNVGANGTLRIENGGQLVTNSDIDFSQGNLDLYDWSNMGNYITGDGNILTYAVRAQFIEQVFNMLYDYDEIEGSTVITPSAIGVGHVVTGSAINAELNNGVGQWFVDFGDNNNYIKYVYSAMIANGLIASIDELDEINGSHFPYVKLTYENAKTIIEDIGNIYNISLTDEDWSNINSVFVSDSLDSLLRDNMLDQLINKIVDILTN